jgi:hypothetical protein
MPFELEAIIREIYRQAKRVGIQPPNATRLVKLVYLADIEWRKSQQNEPLSDVHWRFHHYGPYASEFSPILGGDDVEVEELSNGKTVKRLSYDHHDLEEPQTPEAVSSLLQRIVKEWGDTHINLLLNHVYFNTQPMENAARGEALDFSKLHPDMTVKLNLDPKAVAKLRAELSGHLERLGLSGGDLHRPAVDMDAWGEDEDARTPRLPAGAEVKF